MVLETYTIKLNNKIYKMIQEGKTNDYIAKKLKIPKTRIYKANYHRNIENQVVKKVETMSYNMKKEVLLKLIDVNDEQIQAVKENIKMKRTELAKKLNMSKTALNLILIYLKT